ncbi:hypothetical protein SDC9_206594 [bioreactor metagenome]|uniref:Uncharacterized protein n=1 Tax=bioreactor metagenome TaxID=1076179 RepID=A0A645J5F4_9ZZZZ
MIDLLEGMATDTDCAVDDDNPLRQVIVNTHSPIVVSCVPDESLYLAKGKEIFSEEFNRKIQITGFSAMYETWKTRHHLAEVSSKGEILVYLDKTIFENTQSNFMVSEAESAYKRPISNSKRRTVAENIIQTSLDFDFNK